MDATAPRPRDPVVAVILALLCGGLGHVYAGRVVAGAALFGAWMLVVTAFAFGLRLGPGPAVAGLLALGAFWLAQAIHAGVAARRAREVPRSWLSRPAGLILLCAAAIALPLASRPVLDAYVLQTYVLPTASMLPTLEIGDVIVVEPRARLERGAVVVHAPPRGGRSREPVLKRVVAVAGDTVAVQDGRLLLNGTAVPGELVPGSCTYLTRSGREWLEAACRARTETLGGSTYRIICAPDQPCAGDATPTQVPEGHVFVLGDHRDSSADSRVYGPIPESSVLGRARWIYFSMGPEGVRRERLGIEIR